MISTTFTSLPIVMNGGSLFRSNPEPASKRSVPPVEGPDAGVTLVTTCVPQPLTVRSYEDGPVASGASLTTTSKSAIAGTLKLKPRVTLVVAAGYSGRAYM